MGHNRETMIRLVDFLGRVEKKLRAAIPEEGTATTRDSVLGAFESCLDPRLCSVMRSEKSDMICYAPSVETDQTSRVLIVIANVGAEENDHGVDDEQITG